jgi:transposase
MEEFANTVKKEEVFFTTLQDIEVIKHFPFLDISVVNEAWNEWEIDKAFGDSGKRDVDISVISRILTINCCIDPVSKLQISSWYANTWLPRILGVSDEQVNPSRIFRELDSIEDRKEEICNYLYIELLKRMPDSMQSIFYDLSSASFSGNKCHIMKWGLCKEGYTNHVVLALVVNKYGLPFYWEVLPGNTVDSKTIVWLVENLKKRFNSISFTLVFDRGMVSDGNLTLIEGSGFHYISAMDKNQIEKLVDIDFMSFSYLDHNIIEKQVEHLQDFEKLNHNTWYREINNENDRRFILCFNPQLFKDQRQARIKAMEQLSEYVNTLNKELQEAKNSRNDQTTKDKFKHLIAKFRLTDFVNLQIKQKQIIHTTKKGKQRIVNTCQGIIEWAEKTQIHKAQKLDGFWLLVTNHNNKLGKRYNITAADAILPYREKLVIEDAFCDIKSFVEVSPFFVWTEKHVKAHFTICVLAHFINRFLIMKLKNKPSVLTTNILSHDSLYKSLSDCMVDLISVKNVNLNAYKMSTPSEYQKEILYRLDYSHILKTQCIKTANNTLK